MSIAATILLAAFLLPYGSASIPASSAQIASQSVPTILQSSMGSAGLNHIINPAIASLPYSVQFAAGGVPSAINHQGVVTVNGQRYAGTGLFRFGLIGGSTLLWINSADTNPADNVPDAPVSLQVVDGLYQVRLGDTSLANMQQLTNDLFDADDLELRVWFDDGVHGNQLLSPDQPLASSPYAFMAANVADNAVTNAKLASDAASLNKVSGGAMAVSAGRVGIGVASPSEALEISGLAKADGLRITDASEQAFSLNEQYTFDGVSTNITGIGNPYLTIESKTRIGGLWIITGRWFWDNNNRLDVDPAKHLICYTIPNWPYGPILGATLNASVSGHPGSYFNYGSHRTTSPYLNAACRLNGNLNTNLYVDFTLITQAP